ncbi:MAG: response regulator [Thermodesulfobacteriota bacterium]
MPDTRVLIVDDEDQLRKSLRDAFEDMGYTVLTATSAEDALEMLLRETVDACTVDIRLPGISGNDFILRAHEMRPALKFVIYTGSWNYELTPEIVQAGVSGADVFKKPCGDLIEIAQAIERLLSQPRGMGGI